MGAEARSMWPAAAHSVNNAGVLLVGRSALHGNTPAALLGGRFYSGKKVYAYTDFGGGVERKSGEAPVQGAFRELAEELLALEGEEARAAAGRLSGASVPALVGGRPFVWRGAYAIFIVDADTVLESLEPEGARATSGIDALFGLARPSSELSSVALVSLEELLAGAARGGSVRPLEVRWLSPTSSSQDPPGAAGEIQLRQVMVGAGGSIFSVCDALEGFARQTQLPTTVQPEAHHASDAGMGTIPLPAGGPDGAEPFRRNRWGRERPPKPVLQAAGASSSPAVEGRQVIKDSPGPEAQGDSRVPFVFDMETGDPDDVLTLLFLGAHPAVDLRAVTVTPGSDEQVALVRWLLQQMGLTGVRLGGRQWPKNKGRDGDLKAKFYRSFGRSFHGEPPCERADEVLLDCCDESVTLLTGAALSNLGDALRAGGFRLGRWVAQGGFAGEGVVPRERQMDKFKGLEVCRTWNFGGDIPAAEAALACEAIGRRVCVSKNVCHAVVYDAHWHEALGAAARAAKQAAPEGRRATALGMMYEAMDEYLRYKPGGKKLHDPLALAVALDESVCKLAEVKLFCQKGEWGSSLRPGSGTWISVAYDARKFQATLLG